VCINAGMDAGGVARGAGVGPDPEGGWSVKPDQEEIDDFGRCDGLCGEGRGDNGRAVALTSAKCDNISQIAGAVGLEVGSFTQQDCASSQIASGIGTSSSSSGLSGLTSWRTTSSMKSA
jgi:hypothetical protein